MLFFCCDCCIALLVLEAGFLVVAGGRVAMLMFWLIVSTGFRLIMVVPILVSSIEVFGYCSSLHCLLKQK